MKNLWLKSKDKLDRIGKNFSEENLIEFDYKVMLLLFVSFLLFGLMVSLRVHGSSINYWNKIIVGEEQNYSIGEPRAIRSDEWLVATPFALSQYHHEPQFPLENDSLGYGSVPLLMNLPVKHVSAFFRPQNWGYFFLDHERAFSFYWNFKVFSLFLGFFLLLMIVTKSNYWLSIFGSLWLFFSSFMQWWFSIPIAEMIGSFSIVFVSICYLLLSGKKLSIFISSVLLTLFGLNFILFFYPPFQIALAYLLIFLVAGFSWKYFSLDKFKKHLSFRIIMISASFLISSIILIRYYFDIQDTIPIIMNTVYPGRRISTGGDFSLARYFSGFYDYFLKEGRIPSTIDFGNICESSSFILLWPLIIPGLVYNYFKKRKVDKFLIVVMAYIIFFSLYAVVKFPVFITKISLLSMAPSWRAFLGVGVASIIASVYYLSNTDYKKFLKRPFILFAAVTVFVITHGFWLRSVTHDFFRYREILFASIMIITLSYFFLKQKKIAFSIVLLIYVAIPTILVNPISVGLGSIYNKDLTQYVLAVTSEDKDSDWVVFGDSSYAALLKASGLNVLNGVKYTPDIELLKKLDDGAPDDKTYNRYAHINIVEQDIYNKNTVTFNLIQSDSYLIKIDPCSERLRDVGIDYILFTKEPQNDYSSCMIPVRDSSINSAWIYRYK
ncbi:TPA: hypothetical protein DDW69_00930 [candidate division CPR2 bacterium]|uniref:Glycosyltransferase RgtA/B/C/D-like domain-containing protein n=1 Tax=candidate division CPR2 bacterium GW2011_GWC1_41_48 TaxID=1618344 RepID=A0A0G0WC31_UNCC2|nr:MAG: hypothetical protein UT47_C0001G0002 [candidate division CPR2 bacterium GW2011_GWC2_39_35]KKR28746.1 MAG: hypothetical protein UT60_C0013G0013 [candidate division CPR2 bacterium GW2011_GWD2_39_7]KKS09597.1 MAG: hypothetical protein UU65_C0001G0002 [candidate division CPR2 bacterium GW2011_GWC1_41_48]OGB73137.1 MAG: hypothetical protein A2Y26_03100 [candidate division CPR2 bacterium GWD2_39_7]HBG81384.1 hypothetical protein [candidate division CPR2 bacterium]